MSHEQDLASGSSSYKRKSKDVVGPRQTRRRLKVAFDEFVKDAELECRE